MKIRSDFVTNSSSSSFTLVRKLSPRPLIEAIEKRELDKYIKENLSPFLFKYGTDDTLDSSLDGWQMTITQHGYYFDTIMDNFDLYSALEDLGGIIIP